MNYEQERHVSPAEGRAHESKKESLIEGMVRRVEMLTQFKRALELASEGNREDAIEQVQQAELRIEENFSVEQREAVNRMFLLIGRMKLKLAELEAMDAAGEDSPARATLLNEIQEIDEQGKAQTPDDDVYFLWHLREMVAGLADKQLLVSTFEADITKLYEYIAENRRVQPATVQRYLAGAHMVFQPFSVSFVIPQEKYARIPWAKETYGIHLSGTPVNIVMYNREPSTEEIVRHENVHNVLESAPGFKGDFVKHLEIYLKALKSKKISQEEKEAIKKIVLQKTPQEAVADLQNEMLASAQAYGHAQFFQKGHFGSVYKTIQPGDFATVAGAFETAGSDSLQLVQLLETEAKRTKDVELKEFCVSFVQHFKTLFLQAVQNLQTASEVADRLGGDALAITESAAYVLKPTSYRHIRQVQEVKFGAEAVARAGESYLSAKNFNISLAGMRFVAERMNQSAEGLLPRDKEIIGAKLAFHLEHDFVQAEQMGIFSVQELHAYRDLLQEYVQWLPESSNFLRLYEEIAYSFIHKQFAEMSQSNFAGLPQLFAELDAVERAVCLNIMAEFICEESDAYMRMGELPNSLKRRLESHPLWSVSAGMEVEELVRAKVMARMARD